MYVALSCFKDCSSVLKALRKFFNFEGGLQNFYVSKFVNFIACFFFGVPCSVTFTAQADKVIRIQADALVAYVLRSQLDDVMDFLGWCVLPFSQTVLTHECIAVHAVLTHIPPCRAFIKLLCKVSHKRKALPKNACPAAGFPRVDVGGPGKEKANAWRNPPSADSSFNIYHIICGHVRQLHTASFRSEVSRYLPIAVRPITVAEQCGAGLFPCAAIDVVQPDD